MSDSQMWSKHVAAWRGSGMTMAGYARREGLAVSALQYWARKLKQQPGTQLVRVAREPERSVTPLVIEVGGVHVHVGAGFDDQLLGRVLEVLRGRG
jgi:hypothetical protein